MGPETTGSSASGSPTSSESASLQFDKADFAQPAASKTCASCKQLIATEYFEIGGHVVCPRCCELLTGSVPDRLCFWRALLYGGIAGVIGTIVWSLIIHMTGYELGLIAIIIGVGVGKAVRKGSRGRGGWKYQTLAMVLTYVSITTSYVPIVAKGFVQGIKNQATKSAEPEQKPSDIAPSASASSTSAPAKSSLPVPVAILAFLALVWGFALAAPFMAGAANIMGLIIIGIGLYEAWKFNRRVVSSGPFRLATALAGNPTGATVPPVPSAPTLPGSP